jgi:hypothetical protein
MNHRVRCRAPGVVRALLCVLLVGSVSDALAEPGDARLQQRPVVARPACEQPKPYDLENWAPNVELVFAFTFSAERESVDDEAQRLAAKHGFELESVSINKDGQYTAMAVWLEPEQVAALRCERSVVAVGFLRILGRVSLPNHKAGITR